eukprot:11140857-Lingulodinium_polyedra.AAC.1
MEARCAPAANTTNSLGRGASCSVWSVWSSTRCNKTAFAEARKGLVLDVAAEVLRSCTHVASRPLIRWRRP